MIRNIKSFAECSYSEDLQNAIKSKHRYTFMSSSFDETHAKGDIPYFNEYKRKILSLLNNVESSSNYFQNFSLPVHTTEVCDKIKTEMSKVFNAEDRYLTTNANDVFKEEYGFDYFSTTFFEKFHHAPNDLIAVIPIKDKSEVVYYNIENVKYLDIDLDGNIKEVVVFLDADSDGNEYFINFDYDGIFGSVRMSGSEELTAYEGAINYKHNKTKCLCNFVSHLTMNDQTEVTRINYLSKRVSDIERILFIHTIRNILDTFGYVFKASFRPLDCEYDNGEASCESGYLVHSAKYLTGLGSGASIDPLIDEFGNPKPCPVCNDNKITAGGEIKVQRVGDGDVSLSDTVAFIAPPIDLYENRETVLKDRELKLFDNVVNRFDDVNNNQQQNETRIYSSLESRKNNYVQLGKLLMKSITFVYECNAVIENRTLEISASMGRDYFLNTESEYLEMISTAISNGTLDIVDYRKALILSKYSDNEILKQHNLAILALINYFKPYSLYSHADMIQLYSGNNISQYDFTLNAKFSQLIAGFERAVEIPLGEYYKGLKEANKSDLLFTDFEAYLNDSSLLNGLSPNLVVDSNIKDSE